MVNGTRIYKYGLHATLNKKKIRTGKLYYIILYSWCGSVGVLVYRRRRRPFIQYYKCVLAVCCAMRVRYNADDGWCGASAWYAAAGVYADIYINLRVENKMCVCFATLPRACVGVVYCI